MNDYQDISDASLELSRQIVYPMLISLFFSVLVAYFANRRGYIPFIWFVVSFLSFPTLALIAVAALPDRRIEERRKQLSEAIQGGEDSFERAIR